MPTYNYALAGASVPPPISPGAQTLLSAESGSPSVAQSFTSGQTSNVVAGLNENATRQDLAARFGGGAYAIVKGLDLDQSVNGTLIVRAGQAMVDGVVEFAADTTAALNSSQTNWVWITRANAIEVRTGATFPAAPATHCAYLGRVVVNGSGTVTDYDLSGVMYLRGGTPYRRTADTSCPADGASLPATLQFLTVGASGEWWWDGTKYSCLGGGRAGLTFSSDANKTLTAAEAANRAVAFTSGGTALTTTRNVVFPTEAGRVWSVTNQSNGSQSLVLKTSAGTGPTLLHGNTVTVLCDGTDLVPIAPHLDLSPAAYTQTYATADRTHAALTSSDLTGISSSTTGSALAEPSAAYTQSELQQNFRRIQDQFVLLRADLVDVKQLVNSLIDDLQALAIVG